MAGKTYGFGLETPEWQIVGVRHPSALAALVAVIAFRDFSIRQIAPRLSLSMCCLFSRPSHSRRPCVPLCNYPEFSMCAPQRPLSGTQRQQHGRRREARSHSLRSLSQRVTSTICVTHLSHAVRRCHRLRVAAHPFAGREVSSSTVYSRAPFHTWTCLLTTHTPR